MSKEQTLEARLRLTRRVALYGWALLSADPTTRSRRSPQDSPTRTHPRLGRLKGPNVDRPAEARRVPALPVELLDSVLNSLGHGTGKEAVVLFLDDGIALAASTF